jgi:NAD(P)-dependent dehydrogenase (short-subunit alcohol dehydrogenase family)
MKLSNGLTALVTGGASGIGHALCSELSKKGIKVFSLDLFSPIHPIAGVFYIQADVSDSISLTNAFSVIGKKGLKIDLFINNAGIIRRGNVFDISEEDYDLLFKVNVKGYWLVLKKALSHLKKNSTVVMISSRHGINLPADPGVYALTKQANIGLAEIFQKSYPDFDVKVACPGSTDTALGRHQVAKTALFEKKKRMLTPEELAEKIISLIESNKKKLIFNEKKEKYFFE